MGLLSTINFLLQKYSSYSFLISCVSLESAPLILETPVVIGSGSCHIHKLREICPRCCWAMLANKRCACLVISLNCLLGLSVGFIVFLHKRLLQALSRSRCCTCVSGLFLFTFWRQPVLLDPIMSAYPALCLLLWPAAPSPVTLL